MNTLLTKGALSAAIALMLVACGGGGGGGVAGIGGSGIISSGSVTGFGSVFVNGVEFETGSTTFDIDDSGGGSEADLAVGMIVTVNGTVNADGVTGTATSISFDDQLQGPVSALSGPDLDGENQTFTILGTTVRINTIDTMFDVTGSLTGTPFDFDLIDNGNNVEVSGFFNDAGDLVATRVELKDATFNPSNIVELKGTVTGFTGISTTFTLEGLSNIDIDASTATLDDLPNSQLSNGASVEVKGTCSDIPCSTLNATRVEGQSGFDDADKISVEGLITDFVSSSNFKINGIIINASSATLLPSTLVLRDGARVEVEGPISNNIIQAISVELRGGNAKVHATVSGIDNVTGNFSVSFIGFNMQTQTIAVTITTATEMEGTVAIDNFVRVRGFENDSGGITATQVEVEQEDSVIVQGNLQAITKNDSITVLGASFQIDDTVETNFEDENDMGITQNEFIMQAPVDTLVKVKDKNDPLLPNGIADEIEIETP